MCRFVVLWLVASLSLLCQHDAPAFLCRAAPMTRNKLEKRNVTEDAAISLSLPADLHASEPIELTIVVTNQMKTSMLWGEIDGYSDCQITVTDVEGREVPRTKFGERVRRRSGVGIGAMNRCVTRELLPGRSKEWKIDLGKLCHFSPGSFRVSSRIILQSPAGHIIGVEDLRFDVAE